MSNSKFNSIEHREELLLSFSPAQMNKFNEICVAIEHGEPIEIVTNSSPISLSIPEETHVNECIDRFILELERLMQLKNTSSSVFAASDLSDEERETYRETYYSVIESINKILPQLRKDTLIFSDKFEEYRKALDSLEGEYRELLVYQAALIDKADYIERVNNLISLVCENRERMLTKYRAFYHKFRIAYKIENDHLETMFLQTLMYADCPSFKNFNYKKFFEVVSNCINRLQAIKDEIDKPITKEQFEELYPKFF